MKKTVAVFLLFVCASLCACGKLSGQFAWKTADMDSYRKMPDDMEFSADKPVDWVFAFDRVRGVRYIYVVLQKKELVWVDIKKETIETDKTSPFVHGRIENLESGEYQIVLAEKTTRLADKRFVVYDPEDGAPENGEE